MECAKQKTAKKVAVFGSGPGGLMAATRLQLGGAQVHVFEKRPSYGRKLLIAGSSGLNISHEARLAEFASHYQGLSPEFWRSLLQHFGPKDWIEFIEGLGFETFLGTSDRYFVREMKASNFLKAWIEYLRGRGVEFYPHQEWSTRSQLDGFDGGAFFLGGGSWEDETPRWLEAFPRELGIQTKPFYPTNVGYEVEWSPEFLAEAEGKPLKNVVLKTALGEKAGELVVTRYGLEGTPIYFYGQVGTVWLDLKPGLTLSEVQRKLESVRENLAPIRRVKKVLQLSEASLALLFHHAPPEVKSDLAQLVQWIKAFPVELIRPRPLAEAISSGGGVDLNEVSTEPGCELMLKKLPGWFCGGEMLDWTAPTGGFLIQGCVSQGALVGDNLCRWFWGRE